MIGFDSYLPAKWLDGIFAVHLPTYSAPVRTSTARRGRWASKTLLRTAFLAGAAAVPAAVIATSGWTLKPVVAKYAGEVERFSDFAPDRYFETLQAAISRVPLLAQQSLEADPTFLF